MRNWNLCFSPQPKYPSLFVANLWGIETMDAKMIQLHRIAFVANLWGIETYCIYTLYITDFFQVCSQPMRNWNLGTSKTILPLTFVCSQPMRNWNLNVSFNPFEITEVCSQPMRNWNKDANPQEVTWSKFVANLWGIETYAPTAASRLVSGL